MKTLLKVILITGISVALSIGFHYTFKVANGFDALSNQDDEFQTKMTETRSMFDEKLEPIQTVAAQIYNQPGLNIVRSADGTPVSDYNIDLENLNGITELFSSFSNDGYIFNISVTNNGVYFYTSYTKGGVIGFVYENVLGSTLEYDTLEIVDEWKLFYQMNG